MSVALECRRHQLLSHSSMVRNDFTVTAATCAAVGQQASAVAPHHLVVVIAVRGVDASTLENERQM